MKFVYGPQGKEHVLEGEVKNCAYTVIHKTTYIEHHLVLTLIEDVLPEEPCDYVIEDGKLVAKPAEYRLVDSGGPLEVKHDKSPSRPTAEILMGETAFFVSVGGSQPIFAGDRPDEPSGFPLHLSKFFYANPGTGSLQGMVNAALMYLEDQYKFLANEEENVTLVFTPEQAKAFAVSPEFRDYMRYGVTECGLFAQDMINHPNDNPLRCGLPRKLYGVKVLVRERE